MAFLKRKPPFEFTERNIMLLLASELRITHPNRYDILIPNCFTQPDNEADLFGIRKNGMCDEYEIKTSRSDFLADIKKTILCRKSEPMFEIAKRDAMVYGLMSNHFAYVVKDGVATIDEVPEQFGFMRVTEKGRIIVDRYPPEIHKIPLPFEERYRIARKVQYRYWKLI